MLFHRHHEQEFLANHSTFTAFQAGARLYKREFAQRRIVILIDSDEKLSGFTLRRKIDTAIHLCYPKTDKQVKNFFKFHATIPAFLSHNSVREKI